MCRRKCNINFSQCELLQKFGHGLSITVVPRIPALLNAPLIQSNSIQNLQNNNDKVDAQDPPKGFPVVVFSHGLFSHFHHYSGICSDLASHGYVVAAVEHRDGSAFLALKRVPGPKVKKGQYKQYVNKWIPYNKSMLLNDKEIKHTDFSLRNKQVIFCIGFNDKLYYFRSSTVLKRWDKP